jgi:D-glycero-D-manno-heptose 1,7-bisphosphate phosphatase
MNAVFLAHDSVIEHHAGARLCLRCGAGAALRLLARLDYRLFVLCHAAASPRARAGDAQAGVDRLGDLLFREHLELSGYYSSATDDAAAPALLLRAAQEHGVALAPSWTVGSTLRSVEAGNRAGCRSVLIDDGHERSWRLGSHRVPSAIAPDLYAAAVLIADARPVADHQARPTNGRAP